MSKSHDTIDIRTVSDIHSEDVGAIEGEGAGEGVGEAKIGLLKAL